MESSPNHMHNFVDPKFETQIKCSCTVDDFHGVENLVSNDGQKINRGFMVRVKDSFG